MSQERRTARSLRRQVAWLCLIAVPLVLALGLVVGRQIYGPVTAADKVEPVTVMPDTYFRGWGKPDLAVMLSGQTFGYLQPCGCSEPQYGGLVRRYNVFRLLEKKGWRVVGLELGEIYPNKKWLSKDQNDFFLPIQVKEKLKTTLRALELLNYQDFALGLTEMQIPLIDALLEVKDLNIKRPAPLSLDLQDPNGLFAKLNVRSYDIIGDGTKVGVSSLFGPSMDAAMAGDPQIKFFKNAQMINLVLPEFQKHKVDVVVLFVHGTDQEAEDIAKLAFAERQKKPELPNVDLIVHTSDSDIGPARPQPVKGTNTRLLYMGHKGKDIGVLGLFRKPAGGFELKYELISLGPEFATPAKQVPNHPLIHLMEEYAKTVKNNDFLAEFNAVRVSHPTQRDQGLIAGQIQAKYVGTEVCAGCHAAAKKVWDSTGHSHAFQALVNAKEPSLRQFDPECVTCHTVGLKYRTGYNEPPPGSTPQQHAKHNEKLINVGCESCHGPGSMHANAPNNKAYLPLINPIKLAKNNPNDANWVRLDRFCQGCHDIENDVHWGPAKKPLQKSWAKIAHPGIP